MIEIIEHGNTMREIECDNCKCKFSYTRDDVIREGFGGMIDYVYCPECSHLILIY